MCKIGVKRLEESDINRRVAFLSKKGIQTGIIKNWNNKFIFMIYDGSKKEVATRPLDLKFIDE